MLAEVSIDLEYIVDAQRCLNCGRRTEGVMRVNQDVPTVPLFEGQRRDRSGVAVNLGPKMKAKHRVSSYRMKGRPKKESS